MKPIYLNTAAFGLLDEETRNATNTFIENIARKGSDYFEYWLEEEIPQLKASVGSLINSTAKQIYFTPNFSYGMLMAANMIRSRKENTKVLLYEKDYPTLISPFKQKGFDITWLKAEDEFEISSLTIKKELIENKIEVFVISEVQYLSGYKIDVNEIGTFCKKNDITFIVDSTQSLGALPMDFENSGIDLLIASTYKWLNAGLGSAIISVSEKYKNNFGSMFELGHPAMASLSMLKAVLNNRSKTELIPDKIYSQNKLLVTRLVNGLLEINVEVLGKGNVEDRGSIISVKGSENMYNSIKQKGVNIALREGNIRVSPHYYNTMEEIERFLEVIKELQ